MVPSGDRTGRAWFLAWLLVGAAYALAVLGAMSIGIFVLPVAVVATLLLVRRHSGVELTGLISGLGIPLLYVAYLNREGPGTICNASSGGGVSCAEEWSPWPWLVIGAAVVATGVVVFAVKSRTR